MTEPRLKTPPGSVDVAAWLAMLSPGDAAYVAGCAMQRMAISQGITEAEFYADFARRAAEDPDANVVRT